MITIELPFFEVAQWCNQQAGLGDKSDGLIELAGGIGLPVGIQKKNRN